MIENGAELLEQKKRLKEKRKQDIIKIKRKKLWTLNLRHKV